MRYSILILLLIATVAHAQQQEDPRKIMYNVQQRSLDRLSDAQRMDTAAAAQQQQAQEQIPLRMDIQSNATEDQVYPQGEELAPIYIPRRYPDGSGVVNQTIPQGPNTPPPSYRGEYWQGVYWPYRYEPYQSDQAAYWPYRYWPNDSNAYWQGSPYRYERMPRLPAHYNIATMNPGANTQEGSGPLSSDERAELEMWRRLSTTPVEVTFYGSEAFVRWAGAASRIPVPQDGKIQIKLNPQNERTGN